MAKHRPGRRNTGDRFARIPRDLMRHPAVATLNHAAFRALVLLAGEYHGGNNGAIAIAPEQAAELGIGSKNTLYAAFKTLQERGLIHRTDPGAKNPPRPQSFALEWLRLDDTEYSRKTPRASHAYKNWKPDAASFEVQPLVPMRCNDWDKQAEIAEKRPFGTNDCAHGAGC